MRHVLTLLVALVAASSRAAAPPMFPSSAGNLAVETLAGGLVHPWSLAFLPDGRMLVTERPGRMRIVSRGRQAVAAARRRAQGLCPRQAGLMDVHPGARFRHRATRSSFAMPSPIEGGGRIAVARARLIEGRAARRPTCRQVIFRQHGPADHGAQHRLPHGAGRRTAICSSPSAIISRRPRLAQSLDNDIGKIVRITPDGKAPPDNPFVGKQGALAGNLGLRPAQPGRPRPQSRRAANCGSRSTGPRAATRSTSSRRAAITAGRWSPSASTTTARRSAPASGTTPA